MRGIKKETSWRPRNRNQYLYVRSIGPGCWGTCPTAVNDYLVKFPGLNCEPFARVLLDVVVRGESFALRALFMRPKNGVITGGEIWTVWRMIKNLPLEFLQECSDCVGRVRLCIVAEQNDPTGELAWLFRFDRLAKGGQGLREKLGIHCCPALQEVYLKGAVLFEGERSCTCVDGLGFFGGGDPGCFHWRLCRFDSGSTWWH